MTERTVDLVEQPIGDEDQRRQGNKKDDDRVKALRQGRVDEADKIIASYGGRETAVMKLVEPVK